MFTRMKTGPASQPGQPAILRFRKGEIITGQGEPATHWYKVVSGTVRSCIFFSDGRRQLTGFHYEGDIFGLDQASYLATSEAVTDAAVKSFAKGITDRQIVEDRAQQNRPSPSHGALHDALDCIVLLGRKTAAEKLAAFLAMTARKQGASRFVGLPMSRSDIADHLGLTIHTVSRTFAELARRQMIAFDGPNEVEILDWRAMSALSGDDGMQCMPADIGVLHTAQTAAPVAASG